MSIFSYSGCCVNTQNIKGYTPLHRAAAKGNTDVIRHLLKLGMSEIRIVIQEIFGKKKDKFLNCNVLQMKKILCHI